MDDLIKRQDAMDSIEKLISARYGWKTDARDEIQGLNAAYCAIIDLPSAEPEKKTGKWIIFPPCFEEICMCSKCKTKFKEAYQHRDTCPSCGARMVDDEWLNQQRTNA